MADKTADRSVKAKKPAATNRIFLSSTTDHRNTETPIAWGKALYATRPPLPPHSKIINHQSSIVIHESASPTAHRPSFPHNPLIIFDPRRNTQPVTIPRYAWKSSPCTMSGTPLRVEIQPVRDVRHPVTRGTTARARCQAPRYARNHCPCAMSDTPLRGVYRRFRTP